MYCINTVARKCDWQYQVEMVVIAETINTFLNANEVFALFICSVDIDTFSSSFKLAYLQHTYNEWFWNVII